MTKRGVSPAGAAATIAAAVVVIAGLITLGAPSRARERRLDGVRVGDLAMLSASIDEYWKKHAALPEVLDSLVSTHELDRVPADPESKAAYTYLVSGARSYRLCASFAQPTDTSAGANGGDGIFSISGYIGAYERHSHSWRHGSGESCFDLTPPEKESK
jgi:hypothetical protein